jgi:uncharacterized protein (DUF1499 family)
MTVSRVASAARGVGALAALLFVGGPLAIQIGLIAPIAGFAGFGLGGLLGGVSFALGVAGLLRTRPGSGREGRDRAIVGVGIGAAIMAVFIGAIVSAPQVPPINDITTSPDDPPQFVAALELAPNQGRDMSYPGEEFARQQREAYPDLAPIQVPTDPAATIARIADIARDLGWEVTLRDEAEGRLEATQTSSIFRFVDDVAVRVRPAPSGSGSVVDVRSKSRDGRSDLGANAARIRRLRDALTS